MALHFPSKPEIKLHRSPLTEVICQVKFPPILRITQGIPVDFQDAIRGRFPQYSLEQGILLSVPNSNNPEPTVMEATLKTYRFKTSDGKANTALSADFFALATEAYTHWHDFEADINLVMQAVMQSYHPSYATRVGLRFINQFNYKNTKAHSVDDLLDMFRGELTCLIHAQAWDEPNELATQIILSDGDAKLSLRTGFGKEEGNPFFMLDLDFFEDGQIPLNDLTPRLQRYHSRIYDAFRWCLKDESLDQFDPEM